MAYNTIQSSGTWGKAASDINTNFTSVYTDLEKIKNATSRNKGYFTDSASLISKHPNAVLGDIAYVGSSYPYQIWKWNGVSWVDSGQTGGSESVDLNNFYTKDEINGLSEFVKTTPEVVI